MAVVACYPPPLLIHVALPGPEVEEPVVPVGPGVRSYSLLKPQFVESEHLGGLSSGSRARCYRPRAGLTAKHVGVGGGKSRTINVGLLSIV